MPQAAFLPTPMGYIFPTLLNSFLSAEKYRIPSVRIGMAGFNSSACTLDPPKKNSPSPSAETTLCFPQHDLVDMVDQVLFPMTFHHKCGQMAD